MKTISNEDELEVMLEQVLPEPCAENNRLATAPWTERARRGRAPWIAVVTALALALVFLVTPPGQAWAQEVLKFFTRADSDSQPIVPFSVATPGPDPVYNLTVAQAEAQANFDVLEPGWVPEVLSFKGAALDAARKTASLAYYYSSTQHGAGLESNGIVVTEHAIGDGQKCDLCSLVGASADVEPVQIGSIEGEYVVGGWKSSDITGQWGWEPDPWLQRVRWQANGVAYEVLYMGIPEDVTRVDLIKIAESLK